PAGRVRRDQGLCELPAAQAQRRGGAGPDPFHPRGRLRAQGMKRSASLRQRVAAWFAAALLLTLAPIFFTLHIALDRILRSNLDEQVGGAGEGVAGQIGGASGLAEPDAIRQAVRVTSLERLARSPLLTVVRDPEGRVIAAAPAVSLEALSLSPADLAE